MIIKNITGNGSKNAAKVIGFGSVILQPDEEKAIPFLKFVGLASLTN